MLEACGAEDIFTSEYIDTALSVECLSVFVVVHNASSIDFTVRIYLGQLGGLEVLHRLYYFREFLQLL